MAIYTITKASEQQRARIVELFPSIMELEEPMRQMTIDAFCTAWVSSGFADLMDVPFSKHSQGFALCKHIDEVVRFGKVMYEAAAPLWAGDNWCAEMDEQAMLAVLLLHDIDKPLLLGDEDADAVKLNIQHGVLGAMILHDLGFSDRIVSIVAAHSPSCTADVMDPIAHLLHYADLYSADHIFLLRGRKPYYHYHQ